jgi:WD40 repeat protein
MSSRRQIGIAVAAVAVAACLPAGFTRAGGVDRYGDPLPKGAVARLGTMRWRHAGMATALAFSPDGKLLASVCSEELLLWDAGTGKVLRRLHAHAVGGVDFTPDGKTLLALLEDEVGLWDVVTGKQLNSLPLPASGILKVSCLRVSPDGKVVALVADSISVPLLEIVTGKALNVFTIAGADVTACEFSPDGKTLAISKADASVQLRDVRTGKLVRRLTPRTEVGRVSGVAFSPDGKILAASGRGAVFLTDVATGKEVGRLEAAATFDITGLAFTPDGKTLVAGCGDGKVRAWDLGTRREARPFAGGVWVSRSLALSRDGKVVAAGGADAAVRLWDVGSGRALFTEFEGHTGPVRRVAFMPDGKQIVSGGDVDPTRLWDVATRTQTRRLKSSASSLSVSPDGKLLAVVRNLNEVGVFDPGDGREAFKFWLEGWEAVTSVLFSRDGKSLVTIGYDHPPADKPPTPRVAVWDVAGSKRLREAWVPGKICESAALTPDNRTFVLGDTEGLIRLVDAGGRLRSTLQGHGQSVLSLALSADGKTLLSGSADGDIRLWDLVSEREIATLQGHQRAVAAVALAPSGRLAASAGGSPKSPSDAGGPRRIRLWDVAGCREVAHFEGHDADVTSLDFSPDGTRLVSGHADGTVLVWDVASVPALPALRVRAAEVESLWQDLGGEDVSEAHRAVWKLASTPDVSLPFLASRVARVAERDPARLPRLIADLDHDDFAVRSAAARELLEFRELAVPALRGALKEQPSAEVRKKVEEILANRKEAATPDARRRLRSIQILERIGSPAARRLLDVVAGGAPGAAETREAKSALERLPGRR